ncbi:hypothetical protein DFJ74DRAFT_600766 [Hyaloraphidium curvatum]|nr:hypothetical protein DFJ74DRAFT_600766 [Hyaloraphidium curvatum]
MRIRLPPAARRAFASVAASAEPSASAASASAARAHYDVLVVGGGVAGTALACALARSRKLPGLRVALIEAGDLGELDKPIVSRFSNRVSSYTPSSVQFFRDIGAWDHIDATKPWPVQHMTVWDAAGDGVINFDGEPGAPVSWMIENRVVQAGLVAAMRSGPQKVDVFNTCQVTAISAGDVGGAAGPGSSWPEVALSTGDVLRGRLLVGADGQNSKVREYAGIQTFGWDYPMRGIVATLRVDEDHPNETSWQRFLPTGPVALLPLARGYSSLVWSAPVTFAQRMVKTLPEEFLTMLNAAFRNPLPDVKFLMSRLQDSGRWDVDLAQEIEWGLHRAPGGTRQPRPPAVVGLEEGTRAMFPLKMRNVDRLVRSRAALIGDAAHTIHPLAGQGLNLGLQDVQALYELIVDSASTGSDIGDPLVLQRYASARYVPNFAMMTAMDSFVRVFGTELAPAVWARSAGFNALDALPGVKKLLMRYAGTYPA